MFVAADEPLLVFSSATDAQGYLEAIDVEDGVYPAAYGPNGEAYSITAQDGLVLVERTGEPNRPDDLHRLLLNYLEAVGRSPVDAASLDEIVATVWSLKRKGTNGS